MSPDPTPLPKQPDASSPSPSSPGTQGLGGQYILKPGEKLGGYQIVEVLGSGGMAVVYKAIQLSLNRPVALKVLHSRFSRDPDFVLRFEQEAGALAALNHPNIVNIIDRGTLGHLYFFVMEFVDGRSMDTLIVEGLLSPKQYTTIIEEVREALAYVHSRGIVHRDIKPSNILVTKDHRIKVSDFGIAHIAWGEPSLQTTSQKALGTSHYMAPEQVQPKMRVDSRADIFALGVTFYKMFTRELPVGAFPGPSTLNPDLPPSIDPILLKALHPEADKRYQTVEEFCDDLLVAIWEHAAAKQGNVTPLPVREPLPPSPAWAATPAPVAAPAAPPAQPAPHVAAKPVTTTPKPAKTKAGKEKKQPPAPPAEKEKSRKVLMGSVAALAIVAAGALWYANYQGIPMPWKSSGPPAESPAPTTEPMVTDAPPPEPEPLPVDSGPVVIRPTPRPTLPTTPIQQELVFIEAGDVRIGDENSYWASPPRTLKLPAFQIEKYEVTNHMYAEFVRATGHPAPPYWERGVPPPGRENFPVVEVSLPDALAYAKWAKRDLPTEEQWERAARGSGGWDYPWGYNWREGAANILTGRVMEVMAINLDDITREGDREGCHMMAGNVMEWTKSPFAPYPSCSFPNPDFSTSAIVIRGAAFLFRTPEYVNPQFVARAGIRSYVQTSAARFDNLGFRCVVNSLPPGSAQASGTDKEIARP